MGCCEGRPQKPDAAPEDPVVGAAMLCMPRVAPVQARGDSFVLRVFILFDHRGSLLLPPGHGGKETHCSSGSRGKNEAHVWRRTCSCRYFRAALRAFVCPPERGGILRSTCPFGRAMSPHRLRPGILKRPMAAHTCRRASSGAIQWSGKRMGSTHRFRIASLSDLLFPAKAALC